MPPFLLVHGSCHGAWCWREVLSNLHNRGVDARAIDLPAHGADPTPVSEVTLDLYAEAILAAIDEPAVLVGHSAGGYAITAAAERAPEKVACLIHVCAYIPAPGLSMIDRIRAQPVQPMQAAFRSAPDRLSYSVEPGGARALFYHDCPPEAVAEALRSLCPEPILPQKTVLALTERSASVPQHYILCSEDRAIPPQVQAAMVAGWPAGSVSKLATSHSPFLAAPAALADRLVAIAAQAPIGV